MKELLFQIITITMYLTAVVGIVCSFKFRQTSLRWLVILQIVNCIADLIIEFSINTNGNTTKFVYGFMFPIQYLVYAYLFKNEGNLFSKSNGYLSISILILALFSFYQLIFNFEVKSTISDIYQLMAIFVLILTLNYFWRIIQSSQVITITQEPLFWIATGLLFFYAGNIIATGFYHRLRPQYPDLAKNLYYLNYILTILEMIVFCVAFIIAARSRNERQSVPTTYR